MYLWIKFSFRCRAVSREQIIVSDHFFEKENNKTFHVCLFSKWKSLS